jgi:hypothetical protein
MVYADTHKFVVLVNKNLEAGRAMNAIAHSCAGLAAVAPETLREKMSFIDFTDKDNAVHHSISGLSLIVLRGTNSELKKARRKFIESNVLFTDFIETMTGGTYREQLEKTAAKETEEMEYYCVAAFGEKAVIDPITKRFSLWH